MPPYHRWALAELRMEAEGLLETVLGLRPARLRSAAPTPGTAAHRAGSDRGTRPARRPLRLAQQLVVGLGVHVHQDLLHVSQHGVRCGKARSISVACVSSSIAAYVSRGLGALLEQVPGAHVCVDACCSSSRPPRRRRRRPARTESRRTDYDWSFAPSGRPPSPGPRRPPASANPRAAARCRRSPRSSRHQTAGGCAAPRAARSAGGPARLLHEPDNAKGRLGGPGRPVSSAAGGAFHPSGRLKRGSARRPSSARGPDRQVEFRLVAVFVLERTMTTDCGVAAVTEAFDATALASAVVADTASAT